MSLNSAHPTRAARDAQREAGPPARIAAPHHAASPHALASGSDGTSPAAVRGRPARADRLNAPASRGGPWRARSRSAPGERQYAPCGRVPSRTPRVSQPPRLMTRSTSPWSGVLPLLTIAMYPALTANPLESPNGSAAVTRFRIPATETASARWMRPERRTCMTRLRLTKDLRAAPRAKSASSRRAQRTVPPGAQAAPGLQQEHDARRHGRRLSGAHKSAIGDGHPTRLTRATATVALRSRGPTVQHDCSPSKPIVPSRPSSLPSSSPTAVVAVC